MCLGILVVLKATLLSGVAQCTVSIPLYLTPSVETRVGSFYFEENTSKYG